MNISCSRLFFINCFIYFSSSCLVSIFFPTVRTGTHGRVLQGTRPTAALRPRVTRQRHQARAAVRGRGVVHVVGRRADG